MQQICEARDWNCFAVRPKIGKREKHQGKHGKYPKKLGKQYEETYGEMRGNVLRIATRCISKPLSHQFLNRFIYFRIHPQMTAEYALRVNQYIAVHFFPWFSLKHSILCKICLNSG